MGAAPGWEYSGVRSAPRISQGLIAVTEPTSEQINDEADKRFQTGEADSRAGGERCTDELGGKCQGRPSSKQRHAKHGPSPSLRDQRSASQREESDARHQKERDGRKEEGVRKNHRSHGRMWSELEKSCRQYCPQTSLSG